MIGARRPAAGRRPPGQGLILCALLALALGCARSGPGKSSGLGGLMSDLGLTQLKASYKLPALKASDHDGARLSLSQYRGQVIILNFWASWCPPCRRELPALAALQESMRARGLKAIVVSVNVGQGKEEVARFMAAQNLEFSVYFDETGQASEEFIDQGIPASYILDPRGKPVATALGAVDWARPQALELIKLLSQ